MKFYNDIRMIYIIYYVYIKILLNNLVFLFYIPQQKCYNMFVSINENFIKRMWITLKSEQNFIYIITLLN